MWGGWRLTVAIPDERDGTLRVERVDVAGDARLAGVAAELHSAQALYVEGRLGRSSGVVVVIAHRLMALGEAPAADESAVTPPGSTHASPRPHQRAGHARVLHRGTPRERVVWVRSTHVGGAGREPA